MFHIFEFIIRIAGFIVGLYFILEYIVICNVSTKVGVTYVVIATIVVLIWFIKYRVKTMTVCQSCKKVI
jgi:hypothetical protein